jgi:hypothetical protein
MLVKCDVGTEEGQVLEACNRAAVTYLLLNAFIDFVATRLQAFPDAFLDTSREDLVVLFSEAESGPWYSLPRWCWWNSRVACCWACPWCGGDEGSGLRNSDRSCLGRRQLSEDGWQLVLPEQGQFVDPFVLP